MPSSIRRQMQRQGFPTTTLLLWGQSLLVASLLNVVSCSQQHLSQETTLISTSSTLAPRSAARRRNLRQMTGASAGSPSVALSVANRDLEMTMYAVDTLQFTFGDDASIKNNPPSDMDIKTAMCQVDYFYTDFLQEGRPEDSFTDVSLHVLEWSFIDDSNPVSATIRYLVNATDDTGAHVDPVAMNEKLKSRDFFLLRMVEKAWPQGENAFFGVQEIDMVPEVWDETRAITEVNSIQETENDILQFSTSKCPQRGTYIANMSFGYFPDKAREPTQEEVDHVQDVTSFFMSSILREEIQRGNLDVTFDVIDWEFTPGLDFPLNISFQVQGHFDDMKEISLDMMQHHLASRLIDDGALMEDYIRSALWKIPPDKLSSFYNVNKAKMESRIHRFADMELKSNPLFPVALGDSATPEETPAPSKRATGRMTRPPGNMPTADSSAESSATTDTTAAPVSEPSMSTPDTATEPVDPSAPDRGVSFSLPSFGVPNAPVSPATGDAPIEEIDGSEEGADSSATSNTNTQPSMSDPASVPVVFSPGGAIRPGEASDSGVEEGLCEEQMFVVDDDDDNLLSKSEYVDLLNALTKDSFPAFPYEALPEVLQRNYVALATYETKMGDYVIQLVRGNYDILEDTVRQRQICQATIRAIEEAIELAPTRLPSEIATASVAFMTSCGGGVDCTMYRGKATLTNAFQKFLASDVAPIFNMRYNNENSRRLNNAQPAFLKTEQATIVEMKTKDCPRQKGDAGNPAMICYDATGEVPVFVVGNDKEHGQDAAIKAEALVIDGMKAGLFQESLKLESSDSPWQIYADTDVILSAQPSDQPTNTPTSIPTMLPTTAMPTITPTVAPVTSHPSRSPVIEPSEMPSSVPSQAPTTEVEKSTWDKIKDFGKSELGVATGSSILILIALQCFREILVDVVMRAFQWMYKLIRGNKQDESEEGSTSNSKHSTGTGNAYGKEHGYYSEDGEQFDDINRDGDASEESRSRGDSDSSSYANEDSGSEEGGNGAEEEDETYSGEEEEDKDERDSRKDSPDKHH